MSTPIIHDDPFRLRVLKALSKSLSEISVADGYAHDLGPDLDFPGGRVFRGRDLFGDGDPLPMISILEPPLPLEPLPSPVTSTGSKGLWDLLIQGFVDDDRNNPTDPAHRLMADVKRKLALEKARELPNSAGLADPLGMARPQVVNGKALGNVVNSIAIGTGVVRPPEVGISNVAYFWLSLTLEITEDLSNPFL